MRAPCRIPLEFKRVWFMSFSREMSHLRHTVNISREIRHLRARVPQTREIRDLWARVPKKSPRGLLRHSPRGLRDGGTLSPRGDCHPSVAGQGPNRRPSAPEMRTSARRVGGTLCCLQRDGLMVGNRRSPGATILGGVTVYRFCQPSHLCPADWSCTSCWIAGRVRDSCTRLPAS